MMEHFKVKDHESLSLNRDTLIPIYGVFWAKTQELFSSTVPLPRHSEQIKCTVYCPIKPHIPTPPHSWERQALCYVLACRHAQTRLQSNTHNGSQCVSKLAYGDVSLNWTQRNLPACRFLLALTI